MSRVSTDKAMTAKSWLFGVSRIRAGRLEEQLAVLPEQAPTDCAPAVHRWYFRIHWSIRAVLPRTAPNRGLLPPDPTTTARRTPVVHLPNTVVIGTFPLVMDSPCVKACLLPPGLTGTPRTVARLTRGTFLAVRLSLAIS